jgi:hypothetical protein
MAKRMTNASAPNPSPIQNPIKPFPAWRLPKGVINASDDELEKSIESCERWAWFGGGLVIVGVAAEVAIAAIHPPYDSFLEQWGSSLANSLVAIGVALEIIFSRMAGLRQNELKRRSDERVSAANVRAEEANQKAQEAALELAKYRAPREFTRDQMYAIAEKLKPFAGMQYAGATVGRDPEYLKFLQFIEAALMLANWQEIDWHISSGITRSAGRTTIGTAVSVSNVLITFPMDQGGSSLEEAAIALADVLKAEGFIANAGMHAGPSAHMIHVMVGPKT